MQQGLTPARSLGTTGPFSKRHCLWRALCFRRAQSYQDLLLAGCAEKATITLSAQWRCLKSVQRTIM